MTTRRALSVALIATLALFAGACGGDSDDASKDTTTTVVDDATETTTTLTDDDYAARIEAVNAAIDAAGTDVCALASSMEETPPAPSTPAQVELFVGTAVKLYQAIGATFPAEATASTEAWNTLANELQTAAADAGYPVDFFEGEGAAAVLSGPTYEAATTEYQAIYQEQCATDAPADEGGATAETIPEG